MARRIGESIFRMTFHLPWHFELVRRMVLKGSEVSMEEGRFLGGLASTVAAPEPIIEIGTLFGGSTRILAMFKPVDTPLITVDSFQWNPFGLKQRQQSQLTRAALSDAVDRFNVRIVESDKTKFYESYDGPAPGLVFLDANHSYQSTLEDIHWARRVGARMICGHDCSSQFPGVIRAVEESGGARQIVGKVFWLA